MKVVVTGATGLVGGELLPQLATDHDVVAVTRRPPPAQLADLAEWIELDLAQPIDPAALPDRADAVIHLAQSDRFREFPEGAPHVFAVNAQSTLGLLDWARGAGVSRFVLASTGGVYPAGPEPLHEESAVAPAGVYPSAKYAAELLVRSYESLLTPVVLRFFFVYGPAQEGMLLPSLAERVLRGEPVQVRGNPGIRINPIYVDDAVRAVIAALGQDSPTLVNVAGDEIASLTELVELIGASAGSEPTIEHTQADGGGDLVAVNRRMVELLGVTPAVTLRDGIGRLVAGIRARAG